MIKPVDFHHFGKEYKCKSHFNHTICIRIFPLQFGFCYLYSHLNCLSPCQHQDMASAKEIWHWTRTAAVMRSCQWRRQEDQFSHNSQRLIPHIIIWLLRAGNNPYEPIGQNCFLIKKCFMIMLTLSRDQPNENIKLFELQEWFFFVLTFGLSGYHSRATTCCLQQFTSMFYKQYVFEQLIGLREWWPH